MLESKRARMAALVASGVVASSLGIVALTGGTTSEVMGVSAAIGGTCTGARQGVIKSDTTVAGQAGAWAISNITDGANTPYDPLTGLPNGRRQEQGIKITMAASPATIGLLNAQNVNETLTSCTFTFYRPSATGALQAYFRIKLANAEVVNYGLSGAPSTGTSTTFTFVAQQLMRTWIPTNTSESDSWNPTF